MTCYSYVFAYYYIMDATSTQNYIEVLEKTNQQLSLWYNPYGVLVGILGLMIAILAISFAYILWKQGKDSKDLFQAFLEEQRKIANNELKKTIKKAEGIFDKQIEDANEKLKNLKGEAREKIEKEIQSIKNAKKSLEISTRASVSPSASIIGAGNSLFSVVGATAPTFSEMLNRPISNVAGILMVCPKCGYLNSSGLSFCSYCGNKLD